VGGQHHGLGSGVGCQSQLAGDLLDDCCRECLPEELDPFCLGGFAARVFCIEAAHAVQELASRAGGASEGVCDHRHESPSSLCAMGAVLLDLTLLLLCQELADLVRGWPGL
jgi:hypothetical protein